MSRRTVKRWRTEDGSLPLALLVVIVVAGLASVLVARVVVGERTVRFDNTFTRELHTADAGVAEALFHISQDVGSISGTAIGGTTALTATVDQQEYDVDIVRLSQREWRITSVARPVGATPGDAPERTVVAEIIEEPLFFPGAFGDQIVALNGTSSKIDSYHSLDPNPYTGAACTRPVDKCGWGTSTPYGTGNGTIGTNGDLDLSGNVDVRPGGAFLYDWEDNPGTGTTASNPFGSRCNGTTRCTTTYVSTVLDPLVYDTPSKIGFIDDKFASGGGCETVAGNPRYNIPGGTISGNVTKIGSKNTTRVWTPYLTGTGNDDPTDDGFTNYYCAENLSILSHIRLDAAVTTSEPVVIFVKDGVTVPESGTFVACHNHTGPSTTWCDGKMGAEVKASNPTTSTSPAHGDSDRYVRPIAERLQVYIAGIPANAVSSSDVQVKSQSNIAGVYYAPRSRCGGTGGAGADVYGILLCGSMDNVGNWDFHFDDSLGARGSAAFSIGSWNEE